MDRWIKCVSSKGNVRGVAIQATNLVKEVTAMHDLKGMGAKGLGEAVIGALLIASYSKQGEHINLNIQGSKHYRQALVDAYPDGTVRGYVSERTLSEEDLAATKDTGPWGTGMLSLLRTKGTEGKQPYIGTVPLLTGWLAKDLTFYWVQSEQIPSAVGIVVELVDNEVVAAGGFQVQALPGASQSEIRSIETHINDLHLASELAKNPDPIHLLSKIFQDSAFMLIEEKPVSFKCNCSWQRVERALVLVGVRELRLMLAQDGQATVHCDFCTKEYKVSAEDLERLISKADPV